MEADVCFIGAGMVATLMAERLAELRPGLKVVLVDTGRSFFNRDQRMALRQRALDYGENPWPGDFVPDQLGQGFQSPTMAVGGWALHWSGNVSRFSAEDFRLRSLYGLATDWPMAYEDLEPWYGLAERRIGVSGDAGAPSHPSDRRSEPFPMPGLPLSYSLKQIKRWGEASGLPFEGLPQAKNSVPYEGRGPCLRCDTCHICPTGARYSPDFTLGLLIARGQVEVHEQTLIRRLVLAQASDRIEVATGVDQRTGEPREYRAQVFVVAGGRTWTPPLLLLSACERFPQGLANRSGLVGRYIVSQVFHEVTVEVPGLEVWPGMSSNLKLATREFYRCEPGRPYVRHDLYLTEAALVQPPLRGEGGEMLIGDALMERWREENRRGRVGVGFQFDVHPVEHSRVELDPGRRNRWGDPLPRVRAAYEQGPPELRMELDEQVRQVVGRLTAAGGGEVSGRPGRVLTHFGGGCRMGEDPSSSVCDSFGQTHDHPNLFTVGAASLPTGGCAAPSLTYVALGLRSVERIIEHLPR